MVGFTPVDEAVVNPWKGNVYFFNERMRLFNNAIKGICETHAIPFFDQFEEWEQQDYPRWVADGIHPNDEGHQRTYDALVRFLEARGLEARSVASAELALALLHEWPVDILIADARLAGMTGAELVTRCQGLRPRPGVILLAGSEAPPSPIKRDRLAVIGVIEKPLVFDSLAQLLAGALQGPGGTAA